MTCRTGEDFHGPWGPPSIIALEGGSVGFQLGGQATDFVLLLMSSRSGEAVLSSKVKLGRMLQPPLVRKVAMRLPRRRHPESRDSDLFSFPRALCGYLA